MKSLIRLAESGKLPTPVLRAGIRWLLRERLAQAEIEERRGVQADFVTGLRASPIAVHTNSANEQHYEVPAAYFQEVLGPRMKYSCCLYDPQTGSLTEAEEAMLLLSAQRAQIEDGMSILDLGCGWGSFTLWAAEHFPSSSILAVSNSSGQRGFIEERIRERGLQNVTVITEDINTFRPSRRFDRVVSIEMMEHTRNVPLLFQRIRQWLQPGGRLFVHIFCHRLFTYPFLDTGDSAWMARHFFTGGMMPSYDLLPGFDEELTLESRWMVNGEHYAKTCNEWLRRHDSRRETILPLLEAAYGRGNAQRWFGRWRLFYLACAELFALKRGEEWFVGHYLFRPKE